LDTAFNTRLDELEKAGSLFRVQERTFLNQMNDNPILCGRLQVLDFFLLHFDSPFIGSRSSQKINEFDLLFADRLPRFVQLPDELIPVGLESRQLFSGEIKLEKWGFHQFIGLFIPVEDRNLMGGKSSNKNHVQND